MVLITKKLTFCPHLSGFWSDLAKNFTGSLFPGSPSLSEVLSKSVQFRGDISENVLFRLIGVKPVYMLLAEKNILIPVDYCLGFCRFKQLPTVYTTLPNGLTKSKQRKRNSLKPCVCCMRLVYVACSKLAPVLDRDHSAYAASSIE